MNNNNWYRFFAARRLRELTRERMTAERVAAQLDLDFVLAQTTITPRDRVLEIGCGWGRHAVALAERDWTNVTSIDIAPEALEIANALASECRLPCTFRQQDFMQVVDRPFQAILSLYDRSCCGFPTEAEDQASLRHLARLLNPGGWLVFGINDWPFVLPTSAQWQFDTEHGSEFYAVIPDRAAMTCTDRVTLVRHDGRSERHELTRRHYYLPELRRLLDRAGLTFVSAWHRLADDRPYGDGSDGLFVFAQRPSTASQIGRENSMPLRALADVC
ncbi:MAG: hypothetical protein NVS4B8_17210 [Herpetosiphon sp.]